MMYRTHKRMTSVLLAVLMLAVSFCVSPSPKVSAAPDEGGRVPYHFCFDVLHTAGGSDTMIRAFRDMHLELGGVIEASGWMATPEGVMGYEYAWIPAGGGPVSWIPVQDLTVTPRPDLAAAGIPYQSGHGSAGFAFTVTPPEGTAEGYYDVYVRALDGMGYPCDLAAILSLRYGQPDTVSDRGHTVSLLRLQREGETALLGDAKVTDQGLILPPDGRVRLGELHLSGFEAMHVTYVVPDPEAFAGERTPVLGLKSAGKHSYGKLNEAYNVTDSILYAALSPEGGELRVDLTDCGFVGEVWLTGHLPAEIVITSIEFIAEGYGGDRVAAKIHLSGNLANYFSGCNRTEVKAAVDPALGDVLRLEVTEETNDPYAYFSAGGLLRDNGLAVDAADYKYMVLLARAFPDSPHDVMVFYLCAGSITGATEACTHRFQVKNDGQWHFYLLDLTATENWKGIINGMRFDIISRDCVPGNAMEFASMQFFRTREAAEAAASQRIGDLKAYDQDTDPAVIRDMTEEQESAGGDFVMDDVDTYVVTEAPTEPPTEPSAEPSTDAPEEATAHPSAPSDPDLPSDGEEPPADGGDTAPKKQGCSSALSALALTALPAAALLLRARNTSRKGKGELS